FRAVGKRHRRRSAGLWPEDRLFHPPADGGGRGQVLSRLARGGFARSRRLGDRVDPALDPQHHTPRRTVAFRLHHGPRQARDHNRRGTTRMVLSTRHQARLPSFPRWLCRQRGRRRSRARTHRSSARAAGDRAGERSAGAAYGRPEYVAKGCGMGREAPLYLLERGVRVTGTDGWSWDAPFVHTKEKYLAPGDASLIWEGHRAGREIGYCPIEKLNNLEALPAKRFMVSCFPVKVRGGSGGWTRAVAIIA